MLKSIGILFLALFAAPLFAATNQVPVTFSAMGCGPYTSEDATAIRFYLQRENQLKKPSAFMVHLGDINAGKDAKEGLTDETTYINMRALLTESNAIPTYIVMGDNEWNDHKDHAAAWSWWNKHLLKLEEVHPPSWPTDRQKARAENFAFVQGGVLFIGINLVGGKIHDKEEWATRFEQNNAWIEHQLNTHSNAVRAAAIFCQANPVGQAKIAKQVNQTFKPFCDVMTVHCAAFGKPVLFLHADGHKWTVDHPWKHAPNITRVQLDRINTEFPPVRITVTKSASEPFRFARRNDKKWWAAPNKKGIPVK